MESSSPCTPPSSAPAPGRRTFFRVLTGAIGAVAAAMSGVPLLGYFLAPRKHRAEWVSVGRVEDFPENETRRVLFDNPLRQPWDGVTSQTGVFVRRHGKSHPAGEQFLVLSVNCAHLGCPVSWFPQSGLFMCPCHGGVYHADGERASGPPPRGLFHCAWRVQDGRLEVRAPHFPTLQDTLEDTA